MSGDPFGVSECRTEQIKSGAPFAVKEAVAPRSCQQCEGTCFCPPAPPPPHPRPVAPFLVLGLCRGAVLRNDPGVIRLPLLRLLGWLGLLPAKALMASSSRPTPGLTRSLSRAVTPPPIRSCRCLDRSFGWWAAWEACQPPRGSDVGGGERGGLRVCEESSSQTGPRQPSCRRHLASLRRSPNSPANHCLQAVPRPRHLTRQVGRGCWRRGVGQGGQTPTWPSQDGADGRSARPGSQPAPPVCVTPGGWSWGVRGSRGPGSREGGRRRQGPRTQGSWGGRDWGQGGAGDLRELEAAGELTGVRG